MNIKVNTKVKQLANDIRNSKIENWFWFSKRVKYRCKQSSDICKEKLQSYSEKLKLPKIKKLKGATKL